MGSIDPVPGKSVLGLVARPDQPQPIPVPKPQPTFVGIVAVLFGFLLFVLGAARGFDIIPLAFGCAFMAAGASTAAKRPRKLCPSCRFEIPLEASVCGHCRAEQPA